MNRKRTRNRRVTANWFCRLKVDWLWFCIERNSFKWVEDARDNVIFIVTKCHIHNYFPLAARFMKPIWRGTSGVSSLSEDYFSALFSFFKVTKPRIFHAYISALAYKYWYEYHPLSFFESSPSPRKKQKILPSGVNRILRTHHATLLWGTKYFIIDSRVTRIQTVSNGN